MINRPPILVLVRHGATHFNSGPDGERLRGWIDVPLNAEGIKQAHQVGQKVQGLPIAAVYTSDLDRAQKTAEGIARTAGVVPQPTPALRPWNAGAMQGQPLSEISDALRHHQMKAPHRAVPGGEAYNDFLHRFLPFFNWALQQARRQPQKGAIVLVTHTRDIYAALAWLEAGGRGFDVDPKVLQDEERQVKTGDLCILTGTPRGWQLHAGGEQSAAAS